MGIFGWFSRKARAVAKGVTSAFRTVGNLVSKGYKKFTGQATFEEADALYKDIRTKFERHKAYFEAEVEKISTDIDQQVKSINDSKIIIKTELFPAFTEKIKYLKDIPVSEHFLKECYNGSTLKIDTMKAKADLFLIDFKKNPFKSNALAIISLGSYTRKKAKETLEKVKEEKIRLEEEIKRMDAELIKFRNIQNALKLVAEYYISLIELYRVLLNRLDNSVNFLLIRCISFAHKLLREEMSIKKLPLSQQKEIQAMWTISQIMKKMVEKNITLEGTTETIEKNLSEAKEQLKKQKEEINEFYKAA